MANIKDLLDTKIDEIFREIQEERGIQYGDVAPLDALALEEARDKLAEVIELLLEKQE